MPLSVRKEITAQQAKTAAQACATNTLPNAIDGGYLVRYPSQGIAHAQLSIEALMLFALFLSLIVVAFAATSKTALAAKDKISFELSKSDFSEFSKSLRSACAMGEGNTRQIRIKGPPAEVAADGKKFIYTAGVFRGESGSQCEIIVHSDGSSSSFDLENTEGKIFIS